MRFEESKILELELNLLENWGLDFQGGVLIQRYPLMTDFEGKWINDQQQRIKVETGTVCNEHWFVVLWATHSPTSNGRKCTYIAT